MRYTFISDGYAAVKNDVCYEDQNEDYCGDAIDKLAAYEDAEEQGLLVILPCKVGDTVYRIERFCDGMKGDCGSYVSCVDCDDYQPEIHEIRIGTLVQAVAQIQSLGKTIFLTRAEAEAALKGEQDK